MKPELAIYFQKGEDYTPPPSSNVKPRRSNKTILIKRREPIVEKRRREAPFETAHQNLKDVPIYLIIAHSCLVPIGAPCYRERPPISFEIPQNTYVLSFAQSNDVFCGTKNTDKLIIKNRESIRKYLLLHDTDDLTDHPKVGDTHFSLFTGLMRAASSALSPTTYPNIAYTLNNPDLLMGEQNSFGVYCIDEHNELKLLNNTKSIVKEDPSRNNFMLEDIIEEVYRTTKVRKGIFISTGCLPVYPSSSVTKKIAYESARFAGNLIHIANNYYRTICPTWTRQEMEAMGLLDQVPQDIPTRIPTTAMDPTEIIEMDQEGLAEAKMILEEMPFLLADEEDKEFVAKTLPSNS